LAPDTVIAAYKIDRPKRWSIGASWIGLFMIGHLGLFGLLIAVSAGASSRRGSRLHARTHPRRGAHEARSFAAAATTRPSRRLRPCAQRSRHERLGRRVVVVVLGCDQSLRRNTVLHPAVERVDGVKYIGPGAAEAMRHPGNHDQADLACVGSELLRQGVVVRNDIAGRNDRIGPPLVEDQLATAPHESAQVGAVRIQHPAHALLGIGESAADVRPGGCPVGVFIYDPAVELGAKPRVQRVWPYDPWIPIWLASRLEAARDLHAIRPQALVNLPDGSDLGIVETALAPA